MISLNVLKSRLNPRLLACGLHLGVSVLILLVILVLMRELWYPGPWFELDGGWQGLRILIGVQLVLGPVLTFLLFSPGKSRAAIRFDLLAIGLIQVGALIWGLGLVERQRPLALVVYDTAIYSLDRAALQMQDRDLDALLALAEGPLPLWLYSAPPQSPEEFENGFAKVIGLGLHDALVFEQFRPLAVNWAQAQGGALSPEQIATRLRGGLQGFSQWPPTVALEIGQLRVFDFIGRYRRGLLVFQDNGAFLGYLAG